MYSPHPPPVTGDQLLLAVQKHRRRVTKPQEPHADTERTIYSPQRPKREEIIHQREEQIWNRLSKEDYLATELHKQYGGEARKVALYNYAGEVPTTEPTLMEKVLANRNKDHNEYQDNSNDYMRRLAGERERLIGEQKHLAHKKRVMMGQARPEDTESVVSLSQRQPAWSRGSGRAPSSSWGESSHHVHPVSSIIRETDLLLPGQIAMHEKRKADFQRDWDRLYKPYKGEYGPQSYQPWQMDDYYMVRGIMDEVVEKFLDNYFPAMLKGVDQRLAQQMYDMDKKERKKQQAMLTESRIRQLLMEEILLESTYSLAESVASEVLHLSSYVQNETNKDYMKIAEVQATQNEDGREETDPAYNFITKGFKSLQNDKHKIRPNVWNHTQPLMLLGPEAAEEEEVDDDDIEILDFHAASPYHLKRENLNIGTAYEERSKTEKYQHYKQAEIQYFQRITANFQNIPVSSKCQGVYTATMSPNHTLLALGTLHGDIMVYDLTTNPPRPLRSISNTEGIDDPVVDIAWNLEGTRLLVINQTGTLRLWNTVSSGTEKKEAKGLDLGPDDRGLIPEMLSLMLELDMDNFDFRFQSGPLKEMGSQEGNQGPSLAAFFPSISLFGSQDYVTVALDNGDVLKCDIEEPFHDSTTNVVGEFERQTPKIIHSKVDTASVPTLIGQNITAELFRQHRHPLLYMGFVDNVGPLLTVDQKAYINIWTYDGSNLTSYEWFKPFKKYKLDTSVINYEPVKTEQPKILFSDRKGSSQVVTRQEIAAAREQAEILVEQAHLGDPWHIEYVYDQGIVTYVHLPEEDVPETGAAFHVVIRDIQTSQLSMYLTKLYKPVKLRATRIIACKPSPDSRELYFCLLFPAWPPKDAHISLVRLDLDTMTMVQWRRDIAIATEQLYYQCMQQDVVSFDVSRPLGPSGSTYLFINIAGDVSGYSVNTGQKVVKSEDPKDKNPQPFYGCRINVKAIGLSPTVQIAVASFNGCIQLIFYTIDQTNKSAQNRISILGLTDDNPDEIRAAMWEAFNEWEDKPSSLPSIEQQVVAVPHTLDDIVHPAVYGQQIIMDIVDNIIERKEGAYTEEETEDNEDADRVENYMFLREEVVGRRSEEPLPPPPSSGPPPTVPPTAATRSP